MSSEVTKFMDDFKLFRRVKMKRDIKDMESL